MNGRYVPPNQLIPNNGANNSIVRRRMQRRLGDYDEQLHNQTLIARGGAGQGIVDGPISAPSVQGPKEDTVLSLLREIRDIAYRHPQAMSLEWRSKFHVRPRNAISFMVGSLSTTVAAGTAVAVLSQTVQERYAGYVEKLGFQVTPGAAATGIIWQVRINDAIHPEFANRQFFQSSIENPLDFLFEIQQGRRVDIVARNTSGAPIDVQAVMTGWTELLTSNLPYGSSPATGIA